MYFYIILESFFSDLIHFDNIFFVQVGPRLRRYSSLVDKQIQVAFAEFQKGLGGLRFEGQKKCLVFGFIQNLSLLDNQEMCLYFLFLFLHDIGWFRHLVSFRNKFGCSKKFINKVWQTMDADVKTPSLIEHCTSKGTSTGSKKMPHPSLWIKLSMHFDTNSF
jgi:hypothetical protein